MEPRNCGSPPATTVEHSLSDRTQKEEISERTWSQNFDPRHKGTARCRVSGKKTTRNGNPIQSNCSSIRREGKLYLLYINEVSILPQSMPLPEAVRLAQQILKLPDGDPYL
jgi:hypothetical protein